MAVDGLIIKMMDTLNFVVTNMPVQLIDVLEIFGCESDSNNDDDHGYLNELSIDTESLDEDF